MWRVRGEERGGRRGLHGGFHPGSGESVGDPSWNCIDGKKGLGIVWDTES